MISLTTPRFWRHFDALPAEIQDAARKQFALWQKERTHPSLQFKRIAGKSDLWSVRVTHGYRALGIRQGHEITWVWIGPHGDYERLLPGE